MCAYYALRNIFCYYENKTILRAILGKFTYDLFSILSLYNTILVDKIDLKIACSFHESISKDEIRQRTEHRRG